MRKISIRRVLIAFFVVVAVILVVPVGYLIWGSWITPFERPALRSAVDQSEKLEGCKSDVDPIYRELAGNADRAMELAQRRATSGYDHQLLLVAQIQLRGAKAICTLRRKASTDSKYELSLRTIENVQQDGYKMLRSNLQ